ncbi:unnamed protein product, partial [Pylaiella littoralis]
MYFSQRFDEEIEVLRERYGDVDQDALIVKLLLEEFRFTTVEAIDLPTLKKRERDIGKVYLLGQSHFNQTPPPISVDMTSIKPKALEVVGDEQLSAVARETLPANTKTSKKAVELMGSTKVVTEKKALKRLGSEMTDDMRALQVKTERKEQREAGEGVGAGAAAEAAAGAAAAAAAADGAGTHAGPRKISMVNMGIGPPGSFATTPMARRATRLLNEVPKFISEIGGGS